LFLTERESIDNAIETVEHSFSVGASTVSLEASTIQDFTLMSYFYKKGLYTTPWLWSIIEIVKRVKTPGKLIIGLFKFFPSPSAVPNNCELCNDKVMDTIIQYNKTLDRNVFNGLDCDCKNEWKIILKEKPQPFEDRLKVIPDLLAELKQSQVQS
jgi:hypothetical protein